MPRFTLQTCFVAMLLAALFFAIVRGSGSILLGASGALMACALVFDYRSNKSSWSSSPGGWPPRPCCPYPSWIEVSNCTQIARLAQILH